MLADELRARLRAQGFEPDAAPSSLHAALGGAGAQEGEGEGEAQRLPPGIAVWKEGTDFARVDMHRVDVGAKLGEGNFGSVLRGRYSPPVALQGGGGASEAAMAVAGKGQRVVIDDDPEILASLVSELSVLRAVGTADNPNLVRFYGAGRSHVDTRLLPHR